MYAKVLVFIIEYINCMSVCIYKETGLSTGCELGTLAKSDNGTTVPLVPPL